MRACRRPRPCHHASLPLCRCLRSRVPHLSMNQGRHPLGLRYIAAWVGRWRIACLPACLPAWLGGWLTAKLELGIHGERYRLSCPFFFCRPPTRHAPTPRFVYNMSSRRHAYTVLFFFGLGRESRKSRENLRIFQWEECATTWGLCRLGCNLGYRALASLR